MTLLGLHRAKTLTVAAALVVCIGAPAVRADQTALTWPLYSLVRASTLIVVGRVENVQQRTVVVERRFKGDSGSRIQIGDHVNRHGNAQPPGLAEGTSVLMFLTTASGGLRPVHPYSALWTMTMDGQAFSGLTDFDVKPAPTPAEVPESIVRLLRFDADLEAGGERADRAHLAAFASDDRFVRYAAYFTTCPHSERPTPALIDAYLELWQRPAGARCASDAVVSWRIDRGAAVASRLLASEGEDVRGAAARALGGAGDRAFLDQLRQVAATDASPLVRGYAYEGLLHMLGAEALPDLERGLADPLETVRRKVVDQAFTFAQRSTDSVVIDRVILMLTRMGNGGANDVAGLASSLAKQLRDRKPPLRE